MDIEDIAENKKHRIAIVDPGKCKPNKCNQECVKYAPPVRQGRDCVVATTKSKTATINEELCIGCGICVSKCPFDAIRIINLPKMIGRPIHRFGPNAFQLHNIPTVRKGNILGLIGANGIGKSTTLSILSGQVTPNLGEYDEDVGWMDVLELYKGKELQKYFEDLLEEKIKTVVKPQLINNIKKKIKGTVRENLAKRDQRNKYDEVIKLFRLENLLDRNVSVLSGGELQRFALAIVYMKDVNMYIFDEPTSFLDIRQRIEMANALQLLKEDKYVVVVDHDLTCLDYMSDTISIFSGSPGAYGMSSKVCSTLNGVNQFLKGYLKNENLRFRDYELKFRYREDEEEDEDESQYIAKFPDIKYHTPDNSFGLSVKASGIRKNECVVILGQNGCGKTSYLKLLCKMLKTNNSDDIPTLHYSYKPQELKPKFKGSVRQLLLSKIGKMFVHPQFKTDVMKPLEIERLLGKMVLHLSGGEIQRVAICLCLGKPADVYMIDEPSAFLDAEQRMAVSRAIKRFIKHTGKSAIIIEHDFLMATHMASKVVVFSGEPGVVCQAETYTLVKGMNIFLEGLGITFRKDPTNNRPRVNKQGSMKDTDQKKSGKYFVV
jgi:ATP-binding cassette subfamily E protein 1